MKKQPNPPMKIEIYVEGGVVQGVRSNSPLRMDVDVFDVDDKKSEGMTRKQIEKEWLAIADDCSHILY